METRGGRVIEVDIQSFFDTLDHRCLREILDKRVREGVLCCAIDKWLKAGVLESGRLAYPEDGTPQGGVISPILANVYLHEVLDKWFERIVKPRLGGPAFLIRYADDFVLVLKAEEDARRVFDVLPKRFGKYGLTLHPAKTRLIEFRAPPRGRKPARCERPETFDLLGFTHYWGRLRRGSWVLLRRTMRSRFSRTVRAFTACCRRSRHLPIHDQAAAISRRLRGQLRGPVERISRCDRDLASQIKRAASSVALNLVEGRRRSGGDRLHLWRIAAGSNAECRTALHVAIGWGWIAEADVAEALALHDRLAAMLHRMTRR